MSPRASDTRVARPRAGIATYRRHRFGILFVSLLLTLTAGGALHELFPHHNPLEMFLAVNLLAAVGSVAYESGLRVPLVIGMGFLVTRGLLATLQVPGMLAVSEGLWVTAVVLAIVAAVRHAFSRGMVDRERIFAALDAYLLAGMLFGVAYWTLDRLWPASFGGHVLDLPSAMYFSFVTLATVGYGDVVPSTALSRGLALCQGVVGQMYLAVLVARLVSLYARERD